MWTITLKLMLNTRWSSMWLDINKKRFLLEVLTLNKPAKRLQKGNHTCKHDWSAIPLPMCQMSVFVLTCLAFTQNLVAKHLQTVWLLPTIWAQSCARFLKWWWKEQGKAKVSVHTCFFKIMCPLCMVRLPYLRVLFTINQSGI